MDQNDGQMAADDAVWFSGPPRRYRVCWCSCLSRVFLDGSNGGNSSSASDWQSCTIPRGEQSTDRGCSLVMQDVQLWSVRRPFTYQLQAQVLGADDSSGDVLDEVNTTIGIRTARWDAKKGFFLNEQRVRLKGFW